MQGHSFSKAVPLPFDQEIKIVMEFGKKGFCSSDVSRYYGVRRGD